jgi:hypothetical protein
VLCDLLFIIFFFFLFFFFFFFSSARGIGFMVRVVEFRICLPMSLEEYERAFVYTLARTTLESSGSGEGVETLTNEEFDLGDGAEDPRMEAGVHAVKILHLGGKAPKLVCCVFCLLFWYCSSHEQGPNVDARKCPHAGRRVLELFSLLQDCVSEFFFQQTVFVDG